jgi:hypothetical protein
MKDCLPRESNVTIEIPHQLSPVEYARLKDQTMTEKSDIDKAGWVSNFAL